MRPYGIGIALCGLLWGGLGCSPSDKRQDSNADAAPQAAASTVRVSSPAFAAGAPIPTRFTAEGANVSPALAFGGLPTGTAELALIMDDPDAPGTSPFVHWVLYKIPATTTSLPEDVAHQAEPGEIAGALQGQNGFGRLGYGGPAPPRSDGPHTYRFRLFALRTALNVASGLSADQLVAAMGGRVLAQGELTGTFDR
ncbi:MAG: YbhB/YbcL family Raf kinase inhibitor-like protein [Phycisphaerae bacterium]